MVGGDLRYGVCFRSSYSEGTSRLMHPPQPEISVRVYPKMLLAALTQCPVRNTNCCTDLCYIKWLILTGLEYLLKPSDDRLL